MKKIAAIVVTYNRKKLLLENIKALLNQNYKYLDIFIIDNNSTDGTRDAISKYINNNQINYVNTGSNLGGAGGFQYGIKYVAKLNYYAVWIMDDDCIPTSEALKELMDADKKLNGNFGFLSSRALWKDNSICTMNVQRKSLTKNIADFSKPLIPAVLASFVSLLIPVKIIKKVGLPIKEFFIWTDDWEYTRRISIKYPSYVVSDSIVIHKSANNVGANIATDSFDRIDRYRYLYRNDVYLYRREKIKGWCYDTIRILDHTVRVLTKAKDHKLKRISMIYKGTYEGLKFKPQIEYLKNEK